MRWQGPQGCPQNLRGQIRSLPFGRQQQKAPVLHDEFEPFYALGRTPADPQVTVFEGVTGRTPYQQPDRSALQFHHLTQVVAHRPTGSQIVMLAQLGIKPLVFLLPGNPNLQRRSAGVALRWATRVFHPSPSEQKSRSMSSGNSYSSCTTTSNRKPNGHGPAG